MYFVWSRWCVIVIAPSSCTKGAPLCLAFLDQPDQLLKSSRLLCQLPLWYGLRRTDRLYVTISPCSSPPAELIGFPWLSSSASSSMSSVNFDAQLSRSS